MVRGAFLKDACNRMESKLKAGIFYNYLSLYVYLFLNLLLRIISNSLGKMLFLESIPISISVRFQGNPGCFENQLSFISN